MNKKFLWTLFGLLWLVVSCDLVNNVTSTQEGATPENSVVETAVTPNSPAPETTPDIAIPTTAVTQTQPSLRVWLPPEIALSSEEGAAILNSQLAAYRTNHPDIEITIEQKSMSGQSGILNYLRTGRTVAPTILPDLIAIPIDQLGPALSEELIYPIDGLIETKSLEDLYPAALELVLKDSQVSGYPFVLTGVPHLAYNSETVTMTIPTDWEPFINLPYNLVFPANGLSGGTLALQLYLAADGTLINEAGQVALQFEPLLMALQQLELAQDNGFILGQSGNYSSLEESWQQLQSGTAALAITNSEQYLRLRDTDDTILVTAVPGLQRPLTPLVSGWAWAVSTADPAQRELAAELLAAFIAADQLGEWSYASNFLPAREEAFTFWPQEDPYVTFIQEQLARAGAMPIGSSSIMTALNNAVFDVITQAKTAQAAAEDAVAALQP